MLLCVTKYLALFRRQLLCKDRSDLYFQYQNTQEQHREHWYISRHLPTIRVIVECMTGGLYEQEKRISCHKLSVLIYEQKLGNFACDILRKRMKCIKTEYRTDLSH